LARRAQVAVARQFARGAPLKKKPKKDEQTPWSSYGEITPLRGADPHPHHNAYELLPELKVRAAP
jgi:hypothetical protein